MQAGEGDVSERLRCSRVRRRLFVDDNDGETPDRDPGIEDNIVNQLCEEARRSMREAKERWNFDFEKDQPLFGRYEWVKMDKDGNEILDPATGDERREGLDEDEDVEGKEERVEREEDEGGKEERDGEKTEDN